VRGFAAFAALLLAGFAVAACAQVEGLSGFSKGQCSGGGDCDASVDGTSSGGEEGGTDGTIDVGSDVHAETGPGGCDGGVACGSSCCVGQACVGGMCTGVCAPGQTQCSGSDVQQCSSDG